MAGGQQRADLLFPRVAVQRPTVNEDDRRARTMILVVDLDGRGIFVYNIDDTHGLTPIVIVVADARGLCPLCRVYECWQQRRGKSRCGKRKGVAPGKAFRWRRWSAAFLLGSLSHNVSLLREAARTRDMRRSFGSDRRDLLSRLAGRHDIQADLRHRRGDGSRAPSAP